MEVPPRLLEIEVDANAIPALGRSEVGVSTLDRAPESRRLREVLEPAGLGRENGRCCGTGEAPGAGWCSSARPPMPTSPTPGSRSWQTSAPTWRAPYVAVCCTPSTRTVTSLTGREWPCSGWRTWTSGGHAQPGGSAMAGGGGRRAAPAVRAAAGGRHAGPAGGQGAGGRREHPAAGPLGAAVGDHLPRQLDGTPLGAAGWYVTPSDPEPG